MAKSKQQDKEHSQLAQQLCTLKAKLPHATFFLPSKSPRENNKPSSLSIVVDLTLEMFLRLQSKEESINSSNTD